MHHGRAAVDHDHASTKRVDEPTSVGLSVSDREAVDHGLGPDHAAVDDMEAVDAVRAHAERPVGAPELVDAAIEDRLVQVDVTLVGVGRAQAGEATEHGHIIHKPERRSRIPRTHVAGLVAIRLVDALCDADLANGTT